MRRVATGFGVSVVMLFILSQELRGGAWLESVSKTIEWTGMVFLPLFGLNLDLFHEREARFAALAMITMHCLLVALVYDKLAALTFITVTPLALIEMFILVIPFLIIKKRLDPPP